MTDMERFIELYKSFGIELEIEEAHPDGSMPGHLVIWLNEGEHPKLVGYAGFGSGVFFTKEGAFVHQGFWE